MPAGGTRRRVCRTDERAKISNDVEWIFFGHRFGSRFLPAAKQQPNAMSDPLFNLCLAPLSRLAGRQETTGELLAFAGLDDAEFAMSLRRRFLEHLKSRLGAAASLRVRFWVAIISTSPRHRRSYGAPRPRAVPGGTDPAGSAEPSSSRAPDPRRGRHGAVVLGARPPDSDAGAGLSERPGLVGAGV